jgi:hypothetical protein
MMKRGRLGLRSAGQRPEVLNALLTTSQDETARQVQPSIGYRRYRRFIAA